MSKEISTWALSPLDIASLVQSSDPETIAPEDKKYLALKYFLSLYLYLYLYFQLYKTNVWKTYLLSLYLLPPHHLFIRLSSELQKSA